MDEYHLLWGGSWHFDYNVIHNGEANKYKVHVNGKVKPMLHGFLECGWENKVQEQLEVPSKF